MILSALIHHLGVYLPLILSQGHAQSGTEHFPFPAELSVMRELACHADEYTSTPEAIQNLLDVELAVQALRIYYAPLPELQLMGTVIQIPGYQGQWSELVVASLPVEAPLIATLVMMQEITELGEKKPLIVTVNLKLNLDSGCENSGVQTWSYDSLGRTQSRSFFDQELKLIKNYEFNRPALPLEDIFPEYGICTDEFIYPDLKTAQMVANSPKLVKMAIVDSGVDYNHPYLAPLIDRNVLAKIAQSSQLPDDDAADAIRGSLTTGPETFSHGTAVAFAATQMDARIALLPFRVTEDFNVSLGMEQAIKEGADIINLSLGLTLEREGQEIYQVMKNNPQVLFVVAAGNDSLWLDDPRIKIYPTKVNLPNVLTVASVDMQGTLSRFSNYGFWQVEVAYVGENVLLPLTQSSFFPMTGTSFSSPLVAYIAAQMKMANPKLSAKELKVGLQASSVPLKQQRWKLRNGVVDPNAAIAWAQARP